MHRAVRIGLVGAAALSGAAALTLPGVSAAPAPSVIFVSPSASSGNDGSGCAAANHATIQSAVNDVAEGGTVYVCRGTYAESVTIGKTLVLRGLGGAVVDATGQPYGIGLGADNVTVESMVVENAKADQAHNMPGDGIVTASLANGQPTPTNNATIVGNVLRDNGGAGIDLESTHGAFVSGNRAVRNDIGVNIANDLGKASYSNIVSDNITNKSTECGIVLADHSGLGIYHNRIIGNVALNNGTAAKTGAGIQLASAVPGGSVRGNIVRNNTVYGNGHGGITMHSHVRNQNFRGNRIVGNIVGRNNLQTDYKDTKTTGIYVGSATKVSVLVARNLIYHDAIGIFTAGNARLVRFGNTYTNVVTPFRHVTTYAG